MDPLDPVGPIAAQSASPPVADGPSGTLYERWTRLGQGSTPAVQVAAVALWSVDLPFRRPVATARGVHRARPLAMVQIIGQAGGAAVEGWGECAALADTTYDAEDVATSAAALEESLVPALLRRSGAHRTDGSGLPGPSDFDGILNAAAAVPLAFAALEMAVADIHLRAGRSSLARFLGVEGRSVDLGAVVGRAESAEALVAEVASLAAEGYGRVKIKIGPGWDLEPLEALHGSVPGIRVQVDANGSYRVEDLDHLCELDRFGLLCIEQPFAADDLAAHARLAARSSTPICLDEGVGSPASVARALEAGACSVVCVKPARLGGLGAALQVVDACSAAGVPLWMGGMFESGYGRGVNTTIAALPGFAWPGDLSPARSYLGDDVVPPPRLSPRGPGAVLRATLDPTEGMGPPPDPTTLVRLGARRRLIGAPDR